MPRCFKIHPRDNVATLLDDAPAGPIEILGQQEPFLQSREPIKLGHKVALCDISMGQPIIKFGVAIGSASMAIATGQWIHLHNCRSLVDERSGTLDHDTGAPTDTAYI